ncbi:hypothetical protein KR018_010278 [Drosophila ironensis]|nr:hypothetical protein KR018_010278 [Drosophila ironensis]
MDHTKRDLDRGLSTDRTGAMFKGNSKRRNTSHTLPRNAPNSLLDYERGVLERKEYEMLVDEACSVPEPTFQAQPSTFRTSPAPQVPLGTRHYRAYEKMLQNVAFIINKPPEMVMQPTESGKANATQNDNGSNDMIVEIDMDDKPNETAATDQIVDSEIIIVDDEPNEIDQSDPIVIIDSDSEENIVDDKPNKMKPDVYNSHLVQGNTIYEQSVAMLNNRKVLEQQQQQTNSQFDTAPKPFEESQTTSHKFDPTQTENTEFPKLTPEQGKRVAEIINGPDDFVIIEKFRLIVKCADFKTLDVKGWVNDTIINFYMNLIMERSEGSLGKLPRVYAMNTFFMTRLGEGGYQAVSRWTRNVDIFSKDIVLIPIHYKRIHWSIVAIDFREYSIKYYDSMGCTNRKMLKTLTSYLQSESLDKRGTPFDVRQLVIESLSASQVPQQKNGSDCGVFCCIFADLLSRNKKLNFGQKHIMYLRHKMILEISSGQLLQ